MSSALIGKLVRAVAKRPFLPRVALGIVAGVVVATLPAETQNAVANGDTRTIQFYHAHTHESISATYLVDGQYDQSVLDKLNWFLRDWRRDEPTKMDPRLFDVIWEVYRESGSRQPIEVMSAYRSPETNAMLRRRSRQVAEHSQHILGKAMDQHYMDVPMSRIREIAMRLQRGGVGFYPTAGTPFVHMDVGGVRHWPRMSYDQLARLFPDGKTVHIPSNGVPLPGYEEARAELEARGAGSYPTASQIKSKGFFAWLFGSGDEDEDAAEGGGRAPQQTAVASLDRRSGASQITPAYESSSKDGGMRSFMANQPPHPEPSTPYGRVARDAAPAPAPAVPETPPAPLAPAPAAEQTLSVAMNASETPDNPASVAASRPIPDVPASPQVMATNGLGVPMPPRRPVELAQSIDLPLPPTRPTELTRPIEAPAPTPVRSQRGDTIAALLGSRLGAGAAGLRGGQGTATGGSQMLAYADPGPSSHAMPATAPLPVVRPPDLVGARLDRGNFHALTSLTKTDRTPHGSPLGAALGARAAARAASSLYAAQGATLTSFGTHSSDLSTDKFSGSTIRGQEKLVTSRRADAGNGRPTAD